jgi:hypothetical protein
LQVKDALWVNEGDVLALAIDKPENEIRIEVPSFEKPYTAPATLITKQVQFLIMEGLSIVLVERAQVDDEIPLTLVQMNRAHFDQIALQVD